MRNLAPPLTALRTQRLDVSRLPLRPPPEPSPSPPVRHDVLGVFLAGMAAGVLLLVVVLLMAWEVRR